MRFRLAHQGFAFAHAAPGLALGFLACGATEPIEFLGTPPVITVTGVTDGDQVSRPITVTITVNVGTYRVLLNNRAFLSRQTVSERGDYELQVDATNIDASTTVLIAFSVVVPGESPLAIRMPDLVVNDSGGGEMARYVRVPDAGRGGRMHDLNPIPRIPHETP